MAETVSIHTTIAADIQKVWDFYTQPEHIVNWNFASDDWHCPKASNDLKIGGKLSSTMEAKDGSMGFDFVGVYEEIEPLRRLAYRLEDGRFVTVDFEPNGDSTDVRGTFEPEAVNPVEMQRGGWQAILENFRKYVERS